ncbi:MAG: T9SS type A sorting domain-containing protein [Bacteroidia bacterium]|nr:T9SS type A sorting domain-containing protein [Bacteroidia bacterium]
MKKLLTLLILVAAGLTVKAQTYCQAAFTGSVNDSTLTISLTDISTSQAGPVISWTWDFGDGTSATGQQVTHQYNSPGIYGVCLTISTYQQCSSTYCDTIQLGNPSNPCDGFDVYIQDYSQNGMIYAYISGGTEPFYYYWSNGATSNVINNVTPGEYCVTVYDANQCDATNCINVGDTVIDPCSNFSVMTEAVPASSTANDGIIYTNVTGGTPPYQYSWSNGETTANIDNLTVGEYCVTVYDNIQCATTACDYVYYNDTVIIPCNLELYINSSGPSNQQGCDGVAYVAVINGNSQGYTYLWNTGENTPMLTDLCGGYYCVTVTTMDGCEATSCVYVYSDTLNNPCYLYIEGAVTNATPNGQADGIIDITVYGGTPPYIYVWSDGETSEDIDNLVPGSYTVEVTDANGCSETATFFVDYDYGYDPVDTLWTDPYDTCLVILDFYIDNVNVLDSNYVEITWVIEDNANTVYITIIYSYDQEGYLVVNLTLNCNGLKNQINLFETIYVDYSMITGIKQNIAPNASISVFPNPVINTLNINSNLPGDNANIIIYNSTGQVVYNGKIQTGKTTQVNTSEFDSGLYFLKLIDTKGNVYVNKFIK